MFRGKFLACQIRRVVYKESFPATRKRLFHTIGFDRERVKRFVDEQMEKDDETTDNVFSPPCYG